MSLYEITSETINKISQTTFTEAGFYERGDLQRLLRKQIDVVLSNVLVIAEEFGDWEDSRRRIDLLAVDKSANLIVIELKRTDDGGHMELQALRYAAMVSTMTFERAIEIYSDYLAKIGESWNAEASLLEFLEWDDRNSASFAKDVKIVLVSSNFSKELTTAVMWLNDRDLDIKCLRLIPYLYDGKVLVDVQQTIPLPEAAEYQIQIREKEQQERKDRISREPLLRFWQSLLAQGAGRNPLSDKLSPGYRKRIQMRFGGGLYWIYRTGLHESRVELYLERPLQSENERIFDTLYAHRMEVERVFGGPLDWNRMDGSRACKITYTIQSGGYADEVNWPEIHEHLIDAMTRLHGAFSPLVSELL